jgi:N-acetylglucosamine malate deacetylase 1
LFGKRILLLVPHPDDEIVGAAAAIMRARARGADLHAAYLTTGVLARPTLWPWQRASHAERVERRWTEARAAAARLGLAVAFRQTLPTRTLKSALAATQLALQAAIERLAIDMVWTPTYEGGHQDHDSANVLASRLEAAAVWEFSEYHFAGGRVASQRFIRPSDDELVVELSPAERAAKRELLGVYASERGNLGYVETEREAFRPLRPYDYGGPPHAGRCFYQRFQWVPFHPRVDRGRPEEVCRAAEAFLRAAKAG